MNKLKESMFQFGSLMTASSEVKSETLDDWELMKFVKPGPERTEENRGCFLVVLNMILLDSKEVQIDVVQGKILEVRAAHDRKETTDGLWLTREITYTYEIPEKSRGKELFAEWSEDDYLVIQEKPGQQAAEKCEDRIRLVPQKNETKLRRSVELGSVRNLIEDIQDKAEKVLTYMQKYHKIDKKATVEEIEENMRMKKLLRERSGLLAESEEGSGISAEKGEGSGISPKREEFEEMDVGSSPEKSSVQEMEGPRDSSSGDERHR